MTSSGKNGSSYSNFVGLVGKWTYKPIRQYFTSSSPRTSTITPPTTAGTTTNDNQQKDEPLKSQVVLPDGAKLAYEILGSSYIRKTVPIVLICGMTSIKVDFDRVSSAIAKSHPVLLYDHRGMGDSSLSPKGDDDITIESLARDLLYLLDHLKWKKVALCGHSMGGVIAQQLLVLPYHPTLPTSTHSFQITHVFLIGTRSKVQQNAGLPLNAVPGKPRSIEERREGARRVLAATLDPKWIEENQERFDYLFNKAVNNNMSNRPGEIIAKQGVALRNFAFDDLLINVSKTTQMMVIHGTLDKVIPFQCGEDILTKIPWAQLIKEGTKQGQLPTLGFGHLWYEYFEPQVWHDVFHDFISNVNVPATVN